MIKLERETEYQPYFVLNIPRASIAVTMCAMRLRSSVLFLILYAAATAVVALGLPPRTRSTLHCLSLERRDALIHSTKLNARKYSEYKAVPECYEATLHGLLRDRPCLPTSALYDALFQCASTVRRTVRARRLRRRRRTPTRTGAVHSSLPRTNNTRTQLSERNRRVLRSSGAIEDKDAGTLSEESDGEMRLGVTRSTQQRLHSSDGALIPRQVQSVPLADVTIDTLFRQETQGRIFPYTPGLCTQNPGVCCLISHSRRLIRGCFLRVCKPEITEDIGAICRW